MREPAEPDIAALEATFDGGRWLDAAALLAGWTAPETWRDPGARVAAARAIGNLGGVFRSRTLALATWRRDPGHARARFAVALDYAERHGPVELLRLAEDWAAAGAVPARVPAAADDDGTVWLGALRGRCLATCRDFRAAEPWLAAAEAARPGDGRVHLERAAALEAEDRYAEALAVTERITAKRPTYVRAVWNRAHLWSLTGREDEAIALLERATTETQSPHLPWQLAALLAEQGRVEAALAALETAAARFPMADAGLGEALRAKRAEWLHRLGRRAEAAAAARGVRGRYWTHVGPRLAALAAGEAEPGRRELAVPFVRQHHMTCAPATLAAVTAFLGRPADHLALARAISYDGTPDHEERRWAEAEGWRVREFRVTWEAATALIARGLPFTLVTTWVGGAHLQAVVGCDLGTGTLLIRDPYQRDLHEAVAEQLLAEQAPFGPRGMVLVPEADAGRLDGVPFAEADAYDEWFRLRRALARHDRTEAAAAAARLEEWQPGGRWAWWARRQLAYYDDNPAAALAAVEALRALFPKETNLALEELALLGRLGRRAEHRERLAAAMARRPVDPAIWREQVNEWCEDAREGRKAARWAARHLRARPHDWLARATMAQVHWESGRRAEALRCYRLAAAAGDKIEGAWQSYFAAARHLGAGGEALAMLEARAARIGEASAQPAITLARALDQIDRDVDAEAVLAAALARRPDDGELRLERAVQAGRTGRADAAANELAAAEGRVAPAVWRQTAARLAVWRGDHATARRHWGEVIEENPLDAAALAEVARLEAVMAGPEAALAWLAEQGRRYPHFLPLRQLRLQWLRDRPVAEALAEVDAFLQLEPAHAWGCRERALILLRAGRWDDALAAAELAEQIEPGAPQSAGIVGQVRLARREWAEARAATERALRRDIAAEWLMGQLLEACPEFGQRTAAVAFLRRELAEQPAPAGGFLRFRDAAVGVLAPAELTAALEALRAGRADRWEPWSACIQQAVALGDRARAVELAGAAAEKFPLVPRAWLDLADAHRLAGQTAAEEAALGRARSLNPGWRDAAFRLATLLQRRLRPAEAVQVLEATLAHDPLDAGLRGRLAEALWLAGRPEEALAAGEQAVAAAPGWSEAWQRLTEWRRARGEADRVTAWAREVAARRPGDAAAHAQLARCLAERDEHDAALAAADTAVRLALRDAELHDLRAWLLAGRGRRAEALAACAPPELPDPPVALRGRAAWVKWVSGEQQAAIDDMRRLTEAHPDYGWGWQQLAEWHDARREIGPAAAAARKLAELRPDDASAWGWVASLHLREGEGEAAVPVLERALGIDPGYGYAAFQLVRVHAEARRWERAEAVLTEVRHRHSRWRALRCEAMVRRRQGDRAATLELVAAAATAPEHETANLTEAAEEALAAGWGAELERRLRTVLPAADCNAEAGAIWMRARLARESWRPARLRWLERSGAREPVRRRAWVVYLEHLAAERGRLRLAWQLRRRGPWLAEHDDAWGAVGFALASLDRHGRLVRWMHDWRTRRAVQPWMLSNLAHALTALDRTAERAAVLAAALALPADHTRAIFVAWTARDAAWAGRIEEAETWLARFDNPGRNGFAEVAAAEARALVATAGAGADKAGRGAFAAARTELLRVAGTRLDATNVGYVARELRGTLLRMARQAGSPWRWWYALPFPPAGAPPWMAALVWGVLGLLALATIAGTGGAGILGILLVLIVDQIRRRSG
jgi:tetratricopeptide (TPR) repeat protein